MKLVMHNGETGSATLSADGTYRYRLTRAWEGGRGKRILWIMLNPSTADHATDDATIRRCVGFSKRLEATSLVVVNLFAYRATDPKALLGAGDPVGPDNLKILAEAPVGCDLMIAAWGALSNELWLAAAPAREVIRQFQGLRCLGKTKSGAPRHPLYLPANQELGCWP